MVDLEQFREAVKCLRRSAAACGSSDDVKEADRLLSIIDSAGKVEAPAEMEPDWYTRKDTGTHHFDLDDDPQRQLSIMLRRDGTVGFAVYAEGQKFHGDAASPEFWQALAALTQQPAAVDGAWETAPPDLYNEISSVLNKHSAESGSNTPDYVLAQFLLESMTAFNAATNRRDAHYNGSAIAGGAK